MSGKPRDASAVIEDVEFLIETHESPLMIPRRVGYSTEGLMRMLQRRNRRDLSIYFAATVKAERSESRRAA